MAEKRDDAARQARLIMESCDHQAEILDDVLDVYAACGGYCACRMEASINPLSRIDQRRGQWQGSGWQA